MGDHAAGRAPPEDAPAFGPTIDTDLADYGFSLLGRRITAERGWRLRRKSVNVRLEKAANAFESLVRNGSPRL